MQPSRKVYCKNCNRWLCEVTVPLENPPLGPITIVDKIICPRCKTQNHITVQIREKNEPDEAPQNIEGEKK